MPNNYDNSYFWLAGIEVICQDYWQRRLEILYGRNKGVSPSFVKQAAMSQGLVLKHINDACRTISLKLNQLSQLTFIIYFFFFN